MKYVEVRMREAVATVVLGRGKVNALDERVVEELSQTFRELAGDGAVRAAVLTGRGSFFSFGFDVPRFMSYSRDDFASFLQAFTGCKRRLFLFPKPLVAAVNGHAVAGGCMLALAADYRLMVGGRARISLNEITFGASVFASSCEMLAHCVGARNAERVLYSGEMFDAETARSLGLVDRVVSREEVETEAHDLAVRLARNLPAFTNTKALLRGPVGESMELREPQSITEFVDIWYLPATREQLAKIEIRE